MNNTKSELIKAIKGIGDVLAHRDKNDEARLDYGDLYGEIVPKGGLVNMSTGELKELYDDLIADTKLHGVKLHTSLYL